MSTKSEKSAPVEQRQQAVAPLPSVRDPGVYAAWHNRCRWTRGFLRGWGTIAGAQTLPQPM